MRNMLKKLMTIFTAGALIAGSVSLAACGNNFTPPSGIPSGDALSNGGFVVEVGEYIYFVNGVETYTADNTYGAPIKGSLMRMTKSNLAAKKNISETVIPSLMVASDYTSGIYIYGDRVYYATPNNVKSTSGVVESEYLDFKSAKLDGTDIQNYFNVSDNSTKYRFVEVGNTVYLMYYRDSEIHSYNTSEKEDVTLARDVDSESYVFSKDKEDPYVYYTMNVTLDIDVPNGSVERNYNQIYRVRADATECPYAELRDYQWNEEYLEENDGEIPYLNFGELILDGIGSIYRNNPTIFSHDVSGVTPLTSAGYTYTLQSYENGGLYFTRKDLTTTGTVGEDGWLYYLPQSKLSTGWNSVSGNSGEALDIVAQPSDLTNASDTAIFYLENETHHYIYTSGSNLFRADVDKDGVATATRIAQGIGTATLVCLDNSSDSVYDYVYYTVSGSSGNNIYRAVYNGTEEDYKTLGYERNKPYRPVQMLNVEHAKSWYDFEILNGYLFFADAEAIGSSSYNYISVIDLKNQSGAMMNNVELNDLKEEMDETVGEDGYLQELTDDSKSNLSTALRYYFYTGSTEHFYGNIDEAVQETGKENTLYSKEEVEEFKTYTEEEHTLRSQYIFDIGEKTQSDIEAMDTYWKNTLQHYTAPEEEASTGLPVWAWVLIGLGIGILVIAVGVTIFLIVRNRNADEGPKEEKMYVDTTDDRSVDVYATEPDEEPAETQETYEPADSDDATEETLPEEEATPEENAESEAAPEENAEPEDAPQAEEEKNDSEE